MSLTFEKLNLIWLMNRQLNHTNMICKPLKFTENMRRTVPIHDKNPIPSHQKPWNLGTPLPQQILARQGNHLHHLQRPFISLRPRFYTTQHNTPPRQRGREREREESLKLERQEGCGFLGSPPIIWIYVKMQLVGSDIYQSGPFGVPSTTTLVLPLEHL